MSEAGVQLIRIFLNMCCMITCVHVSIALLLLVVDTFSLCFAFVSVLFCFQGGNSPIKDSL